MSNIKINTILDNNIGSPLFDHINNLPMGLDINLCACCSCTCSCATCCCCCV
jgi:hypothetical protein